jgi:phage terminase large subunit-like protein
MASTPRDSSRKRHPVCGHTFDNVSCRKRGDHICLPRFRHVLAFFEELLCHTKGTYARRPFIPARWQREEIIRPLMGTVRWDTEHETYVRRYTVAWIEIGRKNGKSELLSALMLYLLVGDGEESAEIYGCARDRDQASLVFDVAARMVELSPVLRRRLTVRRPVKRIIDSRTSSVYQVIAADAAGALGSNPSGVAADEIVAWRDRSMWDALRTGMGSGARKAPLMIAATTAGNDPNSFAAEMHAEMDRIATDPARAPHVFVYIRNVPREANPWDERAWRQGNPALGDFLSLRALRDEALEARNSPMAENAFRQFRLNQWVQQTTRFLQLHQWDRGFSDATDPLRGKKAFAGLDLSSKLDMTAWCVLSADGHARWRLWVPETVVPILDEFTGDQCSEWVRQGYLKATEGDTIDYQTIYEDITADWQRYRIAQIAYDKWCGEPVRQEIEKRTGATMVESSTTYERMTPPLKELEVLLKQGTLHHDGNPCVRWHADCLEVKSPQDDPDRVRPVKPKRGKSGKRIDAMVALLLALDARLRDGPEKRSAYEDDDAELMIV